MPEESSDRLDFRHWALLSPTLSPSQAAKARPSTKPPPRAWPPRQGQKYSYEPKAPQSAANSTTASHLASVQAVAPTSQQRRQPYDVHSAKAAATAAFSRNAVALTAALQALQVQKRQIEQLRAEVKRRAESERTLTRALRAVESKLHQQQAAAAAAASFSGGRLYFGAQAQRGSEMDNGTASPRRERSFSMVALPSKGAGLSVGGAAAGVEAARSSSSTESAAGPFEAGLASAHGIAPTDDRLSAAASATDGGAGSASSSSSPPDAPQWLRVEALALELDLLNWVLGEGPSFSREDFWLDALPRGVGMLTAVGESRELSAVLSAAWRPTLESGAGAAVAGGSGDGGDQAATGKAGGAPGRRSEGAAAPLPPPELHTLLKRARDRVNLRLMLSRVEGVPEGEAAEVEAQAWLGDLDLEAVPPVPLSLCMLGPPGPDATSAAFFPRSSRSDDDVTPSDAEDDDDDAEEEESVGGCRGADVGDGDAATESEGCGRGFVGLVAPEGRALRVINDLPHQLTVRCLDDDDAACSPGLRLLRMRGRTAVLLPGEVWVVHSAERCVAGHEVQLCVSRSHCDAMSAEDDGEEAEAGKAAASGGGDGEEAREASRGSLGGLGEEQGERWCAALIRIERCDHTSQYGTPCGPSGEEWEEWAEEEEGEEEVAEGEEGEEDEEASEEEDEEGEREEAADSLSRSRAHRGSSSAAVFEDSSPDRILVRTPGAHDFADDADAAVEYELFQQAQRRVAFMTLSSPLSPLAQQAAAQRGRFSIAPPLRDPLTGAPSGGYAGSPGRMGRLGSPLPALLTSPVAVAAAAAGGSPDQVGRIIGIRRNLPPTPPSRRPDDGLGGLVGIGRSGGVRVGGWGGGGGAAGGAAGGGGAAAISRLPLSRSAVAFSLAARSPLLPEGAHHPPSQLHALEQQMAAQMAERAQRMFAHTHTTSPDRPSPLRPSPHRRRSLVPAAAGGSGAKPFRRRLEAAALASDGTNGSGADADGAAGQTEVAPVQQKPVKKRPSIPPPPPRTILPSATAAAAAAAAAPPEAAAEQSQVADADDAGEANEEVADDGTVESATLSPLAASPPAAARELNGHLARVLDRVLGDRTVVAGGAADAAVTRVAAAREAWATAMSALSVDRGAVAGLPAATAATPEEGGDGAGVAAEEGSALSTVSLDEVGPLLAALRPVAAELSDAAKGRAQLCASWLDASKASLAAVARLPPPRGGRAEHAEERRALLAAVASQLAQPGGAGAAVADALEARGCEQLAEAAAALMARASEPLHRRRELRRLTSPGFVGVIEALEGGASAASADASADEGEARRALLLACSSRLKNARAALIALEQRMPRRAAEEARQQEHPQRRLVPPPQLSERTMSLDQMLEEEEEEEVMTVEEEAMEVVAVEAAAMEAAAMEAAAREEGATARTPKAVSPAATALPPSDDPSDAGTLLGDGKRARNDAEDEDVGGKEAGSVAELPPLELIKADLSSLDRSIEQQRLQLQEERERLRQRRHSRMSAPAVGGRGLGSDVKEAAGLHALRTEAVGEGLEATGGGGAAAAAAPTNDLEQ